jgi:hypothetical protein
MLRKLAFSVHLIFFLFFPQARAQLLLQANVRRTNVATKLKVTYVKGEILDVKMQYKACEPSLVLSHTLSSQWFLNAHGI